MRGKIGEIKTLGLWEKVLLSKGVIPADVEGIDFDDEMEIEFDPHLPTQRKIELDTYQPFLICQQGSYPDEPDTYYYYWARELEEVKQFVSQWTAYSLVSPPKKEELIQSLIGNGDPMIAIEYNR